MQAVLVIGFFGGKRYCCPVQNSSLGTTVPPAVWLLLAALLFFLAPSYLYTSQPLPPLGGMGPKWVPCAVPQKALGAGQSPHSPFASEGTLGTVQCWPGAWDDAGKAILFFLPLLCGGSQGVFVALCCLLKVKWTLSSIRAVFLLIFMSG